VALMDLVVASLSRVREYVGHLREGRRAVVLERWRQFGREALDDRPVAWQDGQGARKGFACGVSDAGALLVRAADPVSGEPRVEHVIAGDVQWEMSSRG
jgi:hypothetical protein